MSQYEDLLSLVKERKLKWYGHTKRSDVIGVQITVFGWEILLFQAPSCDPAFQLRGVAGRDSGEFVLMNSELLTFPCREMIELSIHI